MLNALRASAAEVLASTGLAPALRPGQLAPAAFVEAGDWLVAAPPHAWAWSAAEADRRSAALPVAQQFLVSHVVVSMGAEAPAHAAAAAAAGGACATAGEEAGFTVVHAGPSAPLPSAVPSASAPATISLTLAYDNWYRVPRLYLSSTTLTPTAILTHFIAPEQGGATATLEAHPCTTALGSGGLCVSLHPCQHAKAMAGLMQGKAPHVYLAVLLKILCSSLPLLQLDTQAV
jgi:ubiquitin-like-conjugating enzyme ATG3